MTVSAETIVFDQRTTMSPACGRIPYDIPDLNLDRLLAALPKTPDNLHKTGARKEKYMLIGGRAYEGEADDGRWPLLDAWPEGDAFMKAFPGEVERAQVGLIAPGALLAVHVDGHKPNGEVKRGAPFFNETMRFHIVLQATPDCYFYANRKFYRMATGELWYLNNFCAHSAINDDADVDRLHLIIDVRPNAETLALLDVTDESSGFWDEALYRRFWPGEEIR